MDREDKPGILGLHCLRDVLLSEICLKKEKPAINYSYVVHPRKIADDADVRFCGTMGVIATLEFLQHLLA
jgi:hypothetical protein